MGLSFTFVQNVDKLAALDLELCHEGNVIHAHSTTSDEKDCHECPFTQALKLKKSLKAIPSKIIVINEVCCIIYRSKSTPSHHN